LGSLDEGVYKIEEEEDLAATLGPAVFPSLTPPIEQLLKNKANANTKTTNKILRDFI
jgi:hypothetical protein